MRGRNDFLYEDVRQEGILGERLLADSIPLVGQPRRRGGEMIACSSSKQWP